MELGIFLYDPSVPVAGSGGLGRWPGSDGPRGWSPVKESSEAPLGPGAVRSLARAPTKAWPCGCYALRGGREGHRLRFEPLQRRHGRRSQLRCDGLLKFFIIVKKKMFF